MTLEYLPNYIDDQAFDENSIQKIRDSIQAVRDTMLVEHFSSGRHDSRTMRIHGCRAGAVYESLTAALESNAFNVSSVEINGENSTIHRFKFTKKIPLFYVPVADFIGAAARRTKILKIAKGFVDVQLLDWNWTPTALSAVTSESISLKVWRFPS